MLNPAWNLPTTGTGDSLSNYTETWGVLVAADGSDSISLLINPQTLKRSLSANTSQFSIYQNSSRVFWLSNNPETINLSLTVTGGTNTDITPILEKLKSALGKKWRYVHNQRVLPAAYITSIDIDERQWFDGQPTLAEVGIQMTVAGDNPLVTFVYPYPSVAEVDDYLKQAAALGFNNLSALGFDIFSSGSLIGTGSHGSLVLFSL